MIPSTIEIQIPEAKDAFVSDNALRIELSDGRVISVPLNGTLGSSTQHLKSGIIGSSLATVREYIGPIWMRTSALKV